MTKTVLLAAAGLAIALAAELGFDRSDRARRASDPAIEVLVAKGRFAGETLAAISIESSEGSLFYARKRGQWRCREAYGALCDEAAIRALLESLLEARGVERTLAEHDEEAFGFQGDERLQVRFHGTKALQAPDGHVLVGFEVGRSFDEGPHGRAFVRVAGSKRVLEIDRDPRRALASESAAVPPLVDTQFLAGSLAGEFRGFREIRIEPAVGEAMRIFRDPAAPEQPDSPWILERGGRRESFPGWRVGGYVGLWLRGRFDAYDRPHDLGSLGLDSAASEPHRRPAARIVLVPEGSDAVQGSVPIELAVSEVDDRRRARVWNGSTGVVGIVPAELQFLLAPVPEMFLDVSRPNPWEAWLGKP